MKTIRPHEGLCDSESNEEKRCQIRTIFNGTEKDKDALENAMKKMRTVEELCRDLKMADIQVTNQRDKETGLTTIRELARSILEQPSKSPRRQTEPASLPSHAAMARGEVPMAAEAVHGRELLRGHRRLVRWTVRAVCESQ